MLLEDHSGARWRGNRLGRQPTAVRRGVGGFRVTQHLHRPVTHDKQAETAGRERYDALVGERTERFRDGLIRRRVVLPAHAGMIPLHHATNTPVGECPPGVKKPGRWVSGLKAECDFRGYLEKLGHGATGWNGAVFAVLASWCGELVWHI